MDYSKHVNTRTTPQTERTPGRTNEVENSAGGYVYAINDWQRLDRFLILGSEGGTYYVNERKLAKNNADTILKLIKEDGKRVVDVVTTVSVSGQAHKNDAALFVLAACAKLGDQATRTEAYKALPLVARIGTHLFQFCQFVEAFGGWGSGMRRAIARWYHSKDPEQLAYLLLKYRQRDGWSHRDVLRLAHVIPKNDAYDAIFKATTHPDTISELIEGGRLPSIYKGYLEAQNSAPNPALIQEYNLSWEMLPTEWLKDPAINEHLLTKMPLMATVRQLGRLSANGTIKPLSSAVTLVSERLTNDRMIEQSRIHPMHYLLALKTYESGKGHRGDLHWVVDAKILTALNEGFYKSFTNVEPTGKTFMLGVDVSGSMSWLHVGNTNITAAEAAAAMALVIAKTEPNHFIHGFSNEFVNLGIGPSDNLAQACKKVQLSTFGSTDCALPMLYALEHKILVDTFIVLTDNETWAGRVKPVDALRQYREQMNRSAKLVVVAMTSSGFSIADPNDAGMLDVVGFDADVLPTIMAFS